MSKIFARLRRATFTILPRSGPLLSFCPKSTPRRAFSVLTQIGRTFRIPSDYGRRVGEEARGVPKAREERDNSFDSSLLDPIQNVALQ